jgi:hypothetical protein
MVFFLTAFLFPTGAILSPVLFYFDNLLLVIRAEGTGCFIESWFFGTLAYAGDVLLAPTAGAMHAPLIVSL